VQSIFWLEIFSTKIKKLDFVFKSLKLYFYILFLVASRNTCIKVVDIASICVNIFKEFEDINTIIVFVNTIDSLYINRSSNSNRTIFFYLLKF